MFLYKFHLKFLLLIIALSIISPTLYGDNSNNPRAPHKVIKKLSNRMYAIGETTGKIEDFIAAEIKASGEIAAFITNGQNQEALISRNSAGQTPLMAAAFMGYSRIIEQLLKSENVIQHLETESTKEITAWEYANLGFRQTAWLCHPKILKDPFRWVPLWVTQPYYQKSEVNPYLNTRFLLQQAGAETNQANTRSLWLNDCKIKHRIRKKIEKSDDVLLATQELAKIALDKFIAKSQ